MFEPLSTSFLCACHVCILSLDSFRLILSLHCILFFFFKSVGCCDTTPTTPTTPKGPSGPSLRWNLPKAAVASGRCSPGRCRGWWLAVIVLRGVHLSISLCFSLVHFLSFIITLSLSLFHYLSASSSTLSSTSSGALGLALTRLPIRAVAALA